MSALLHFVVLTRRLLAILSIGLSSPSTQPHHTVPHQLCIAFAPLILVQRITVKHPRARQGEEE